MVATVSVFAAACASQSSSTVQSASAVHIQLAAADGRADSPATFTSPYGDFLAGMVASHERDLSAAADFMQRAWEGDPENFSLLRRAFLLVAAEGRQADRLRMAA